MPPVVLRDRGSVAIGRAASLIAALALVTGPLGLPAVAAAEPQAPSASTNPAPSTFMRDRQGTAPWQTTIYPAPTADITAVLHRSTGPADRGSLVVTVVPPVYTGYPFTVALYAAQGQDLEVGSLYRGLAFDGDLSQHPDQALSSCDGHGGPANAIVSDVAADPDGTVTSLAFDLWCTDDTYDVVRINSALPYVDVSTTETALAAVYPGESANTTRTITATGTGPLELGAFEMRTVLRDGTSEPGSTEYMIVADGCSGAVLAPGDSCSIDVQFIPLSAGPWHVVELVAPANTPAETVGLGAAGIVRDPISIDGVTDFGDQPGYDPSAPHRFVVTVAGALPATFGVPIVDEGQASPFEVTADTCSSAPVAAGTSCWIEVAFTPTSNDRFSSRIVIGGDGVGGTHAFYVQGVGESPVSIPEEFDFGAQAPGTHITRSVAVDSVTSVPITITAVVVAQVGDHNGELSLDSETCTAAPIPPHGSCSITFAFDLPAGAAPTNTYENAFEVDIGGWAHGLIVVRGAAAVPDPTPASPSPSPAAPPPDVTAPAGSVTIDGGDAYASSADVSLAVPATDAGTGVARIALSNDGVVWTERAYSPTQSWTLSVGDGPKTVYTKWLDSAGNWSAVANATTVLDTLAPSGSLTVASGGAYTNSIAVTLDVPATAVSGVTQVALSNDGSTWTMRDYAAMQAWTLAGGDGARTIYARWRSGAGLWSGVATEGIVLDTVAPTAGAPARVSAAGSTVGGGPAVLLSWSGSDSNSGIARYELDQSTDGRAYALVSSSLAGPSLTRVLAAGHTYRLRVRAIDRAGNTGAWAYGTSFTLRAYQESSGSIRYGGWWRTGSSSAYWGGHDRYATGAGATARLTFTGRSFAWVGSVGPSRGSARIYVNGVLVKTISLWARSNANRRVLYAVTWSRLATRTVTIRVSGTAGHPRLDVDALLTTN